jgi:hypothetical protein
MQNIVELSRAQKSFAGKYYVKTTADLPIFNPKRDAPAIGTSFAYVNDTKLIYFLDIDYQW